MFEVVWNYRVYKVYSVEDSKITSGARFLIFDGSRWRWIVSDECAPVED